VLLADFVIVSCGALTAVIAVPVHPAAPGQLGSPPPDTLAVLPTLPTAASVGVTGIKKLTLAPAASPPAIVQVTCCPTALQPPGNVPIVKPAGIVSTTLALAVVAAAPMLVTSSA
jgi:hypothetical protein